jgi:hypothetical protein
LFAETTKKKGGKKIFFFLQMVSSFQAFTFFIFSMLFTITESNVSTALSQVKVQYLVSTKNYNVASSPNTFFTRSLGYDFNKRIVNDGKNSSAADTDDTPLEYIPLGFHFNYYGTRSTSVWTNPNGGLQFTPTPPCGCCFSTYTSTGRCDYNSSYYNMIALSVTDLAPIDNKNCHVKYNTLKEDKIFGLAFINVPLFGIDPKPGPTWTFGVTISNKGKIATSYQKIYDTSNPPGTPPPTLAEHVADSWIIGLRSPKAYNDALKTADSTYSLLNQDSWKTSIRGHYPPKKDVINGVQITYCPVPTSLCLQPSRGIVQGSGVGTEETLTFTGNSPFGCNATDMPMKCRFYLPTNVQDSRFNGHVDTDVVYVSNSGSGNNNIVKTIKCKTPSIVATTVGGSALSWINIEIMYASKQGSDNDIHAPFTNYVWKSMPTSNLLKFQFLNTGVGTNINTCDNTGTSTKVCDTCGSCGGTNTCITSTCDGQYDSSIDCAGVCNGNGIIGTNNKCCESPLYLDCNGICNGTTIEAWVQFPSILAKGCCQKAAVDCTGLCNGKAKIDRCNVCSGGTTGIIANANMDCLGLCPNDPNRLDPNGQPLPCDPSVDIGVIDRGNGSGTGGTGSNTPLSLEGGMLVWEIDTSNIQGGGGEGSGGNSDNLVKMWSIGIKNDGPIRVFMKNLIITNSKPTAHPPITMVHDAKQADFDKNTLVIPPRSTVTMNITVDMRMVLIDPIVPAPRRHKAIEFQYTYGGPHASVFSVIIPIQVSSS